MGDHRHISRELLLAARRGELSGEDLVERLLATLGELCPVCRDVVLGVAAAATPPPDATGGPPGRTLDLAALLAHVERESVVTAALLPRLQDLSAEQRLLRLRSSLHRHGNPAMAEALLDRARAALPGDPEDSLAWARAAELVAEACPTSGAGHRVLALAYQGNAHRAAGDFHRGRALLVQARALAARSPGTDPDVRAELHNLSASLLTDLSLFPQATHELHRALEHFRTLGDDHGRAMLLTKLGVVRGLMDEPRAALVIDHEATKLLGREESSPLHLCARFNCALHLLEAGRPGPARDVLDYEREAYVQAGFFLRVRFDGLQARLAAAFGDAKRSERSYLAVVDQLLSERQGFPAAQNYIDLGGLYQGQGRLRDLRTVAGRAAECFESHALPLEARAVRILHRGTRRGVRFTTSRLNRLVASLRRSSPEPSLTTPLQG